MNANKQSEPTAFDINQTHTKWFSDFRKRLILSGVASPFEIVGCTKKEVAAVQADHRFLLPTAYVSFLSAMGIRAGRFMYGTCMFFPGILDLREDGLDLIRMDPEAEPLPEKALIIAMHGGYLLAWVPTESGTENPPVFYYWDTKKMHFEESDAFTSFLEKMLSDDIDCLMSAKLITPPGVFLRILYWCVDLPFFQGIRKLLRVIQT